MKAGLIFLADRRAIIRGTILFGAVVIFNNWLLALLLNRRLLFRGGSISELSIHGQPHALIFQSLDVASGILFALFALFVRKIMPRPGPRGLLLIWGTFIFGVANSVDALLALPCSNTLDKGCNIPISINWSHFNFPSHGYSSVLIAICYFVLPLAGFLYARSNKENLFYRTSMVAIVVALASLISAAWQYLNLHAFSVKASGWAQGVQMLVLGAWFISWYRSVNGKHSASKDED